MYNVFPLGLFINFQVYLSKEFTLTTKSAAWKRKKMVAKSDAIDGGFSQKKHGGAPEKTAFCPKVTPWMGGTRKNTPNPKKCDERIDREKRPSRRWPSKMPRF